MLAFELALYPSLPVFYLSEKVEGLVNLQCNDMAGQTEFTVYCYHLHGFSDFLENFLYCNAVHIVSWSPSHSSILSALIGGRGLHDRELEHRHLAHSTNMKSE